MEGAGVHLRRAFGFGNTSDFDPFLLLDDFRNDVPEHYRAGFPWHPHRGIETITYVLAGTVEHGDSLGNSGAIAAGDVQWMTAGSGIIHQEMPKGDDAGRMHGFQLWANLPSSLKMTAPRYQEVAAADIPVVTDNDGTRVPHRLRKFLGEIRTRGRNCRRPDLSRRVGPAGQAKGLAGGDDSSMPSPTSFKGPASSAMPPIRPPCELKESARRRRPHAAEADNRSLVLFDRGDEITVQAGEDGIRFLLVSGKPLGEPVAWRGPIVMNTQEQLRQAFDELQKGTFLRPERET